MDAEIVHRTLRGFVMFVFPYYRIMAELDFSLDSLGREIMARWV